jgi:hypothetical protein
MSKPKPPLYPFRVAVVTLVWLAVVGGLVYLWGWWVGWNDWCWKVLVAGAATAAGGWILDLGYRLRRPPEPDEKKGRWRRGWAGPGGGPGTLCLRSTVQATRSRKGYPQRSPSRPSRDRVRRARGPSDGHLTACQSPLGTEAELRSQGTAPARKPAVPLDSRLSTSPFGDVPACCARSSTSDDCGNLAPRSMRGGPPPQSARASLQQPVVAQHLLQPDQRLPVAPASRFRLDSRQPIRHTRKGAQARWAYGSTRPTHYREAGFSRRAKPGGRREGG